MVIEINGKKVFDTLEEIIDPRHTAIIVVDVQNDFCSEGGYFHKVLGSDLSTINRMIPRLIRFIGEARDYGMMIVFIQNTRLRNHKSDSPSWLLQQMKLGGGVPQYTIERTWGQDFVEGLQPLDGEPMVKKFRWSAFVNTNLDRILRSNNIKSLVITGVVTEGCVESTVRDASFHDYYVVVVRDCVASTDKERHEASLRFISWRWDVVNSNKIISVWKTRDKEELNRRKTK